MKTIDPNKEIATILPTHMLVTLWHVMNASAPKQDKITDVYQSYLDVPLFYRGGQKSSYWNKIDNILKKEFGVDDIELIKYKETFEFKLDGEYTAKLNGDKISVGCHEFPVEKIRELIKAIDKNKIK